MNHDVFVSFSFTDQKMAEKIVNILTSNYGISCWICIRDIGGGINYKRLIPEAIRAAKIVVFLQSVNSVESREIPKEIGIAFDADKTIIPFRLDSTPLHGELEYDLYGIEYIDATVPTMEQRILDLAKSISRAIGKTSLTESTAEMTPVLRSTRIACSEIFAGRDKLIETIHEDFTLKNTIFLCGMGGIGKSQLACQYWKAYRDFYTTVVFGRYESSLIELIADDTVFKVEGVTRKTTAKNTLQTDDEYAREKLLVLKQAADEHTLIIIDNYDVAADSFFDEFVREAPYRVLITSRCAPATRDNYHRIPVEEIDTETLKDIFIQYANPQKTIIDRDDPAFQQLFEMTNRHTYTLELLANYMEENNKIDEIGELIELLKKNGFATLSTNVYDTIHNLFRLTSLNEQEKTFMRCLAMMPSTGVPQKLFKQWIGDVFTARSRLVDLGLVKINGDTRSIGLHPIIKEVVLTELHPAYENCKEFINRCTMVGKDRIPLMWNLPYTEKKIYLDCYKSILEIIGAITAETFPVYENISLLFNCAGDYTETIQFHKGIYGFSCEKYGEQSNESMLILNRIGWKHSNVMNYEAAIECLEKAADWFIKNPDYSSREAQSVIQSCGDVYIALFEKHQVPDYLDKALYYAKQFDAYGKEMLANMTNESESFKTFLRYQLACINRSYFKIFLHEKKFDEAERALKKTKEATDTFMAARYLTEFADVADLNKNWGMLYFNKCMYNEAILALEESYTVYQKFFSDTNGRLIGVADLLIQCYLQLKNEEGARKYIEIIDGLAHSLYTKDHPIFGKINEYKMQLDQMVM